MGVCASAPEAKKDPWDDPDNNHGLGPDIEQEEGERLDPKDFMFMDLTGEVKYRTSGAMKGKDFIISGCTDCDFFLMDFSAQVTIENCNNCRIFVGPCESSVYFRDCNDCKFILACQQLRTRDSKNIDLLLYCGTRPTIESTSSLRIGCFQFAYFDLVRHFEQAGLSVFNNPWTRIHDFTSSGGPHYRLLPPETGPLDLMDRTKLFAVLDESEFTTGVCPVPRTTGTSPDSKNSIFVGAFGKDRGEELLTALNPLIIARTVAYARTAQVTVDDKQAKQFFGSDKSLVDACMTSIKANKRHGGLVGVQLLCVDTDARTAVQQALQQGVQSTHLFVGTETQCQSFFTTLQPNDQI